MVENFRKIFTKEMVMRWEMEIGSFYLNLLMTSLLKEVKWGSNQSPLCGSMTREWERMSD